MYQPLSNGVNRGTSKVCFQVLSVPKFGDVIELKTAMNVVFLYRVKNPDVLASIERGDSVAILDGTLWKQIAPEAR